MKTKVVSALVLLLIVVVPGYKASGGPINFNVVFTPANMYCDDWMPFSQTGARPIVNTSFSKDSSSSYAAPSTGKSRTLAFGDFGYQGWMQWPYVSGLPATRIWADIHARYTVSVSVSGKPCSGSSVINYWGSAGVSYGCDNYMAVSIGGPSQTSSLSLGCGNTTVRSRVIAAHTNPHGWWYPDGGTLWRGQPEECKVELALSFDLRDPLVSISSSASTINTASPGTGGAPVTFTVSNEANALVNSLLLGYDDGSSLAVPFSQASSLKFTTTASHTFALTEGEDARTFHVTATAYGPSDNSSDDDQDSDSMDLTVLRSPLAAISLDGALVPYGSVVDVTAGQSLPFDGSPATGFIEDAVLTLGDDEILATTSTSGNADELCHGTLTIPDLAVGEDVLLEYCTSNTGAGLNSNTWSATLHVVPEPSSLGILAIATLALAIARRREKRLAIGGNNS